MKNIQQSEKLLPFFVYAIFDPNENKPFYVGMGQGKRDEAHKSGDKDRKERKIKEIEERGAKEIRVLIGRYETKEEAMSVETTLIKWVYGFENLTNQIQGRKHIYIRSYNNKFEHLDRIDREKNIQIHSGEYTKDLLDKIQSNKIMPKLAYVKELLRSNFSDWDISEELMLTSQDPCVLISGFSDYLQIQVRMPVRTGKFFTINYLPMSTKYKKDFQNIINQIFPNEKIPGGGRYGKYFTFKENGKKFKLNFEESIRIVEIIPNLIRKITASTP